MTRVIEKLQAPPREAREHPAGTTLVNTAEDLRHYLALLTALFKRWENLRDDLDATFGPPEAP